MIGFYPSALSSSFRSGNHPRAETSPPLPCSALAKILFRETRLLLKRLSQSPVFEAPRYQRGTAEPPAATEDLPGLVTVSAVKLTLLGGPTSRPSLYVPASRLGI